MVHDVFMQVTAADVWDWETIRVKLNDKALHKSTPENSKTHFIMSHFVIIVIFLTQMTAILSLLHCSIGVSPL